MIIIKGNAMESSANVTIMKANPGGQRLFVRSNVDVCFFGGTLGSGKLLSVNELVLTPDGWVKNGTLKAGDMVCTPFGKPTKILQVFPHKNKDIYVLRTSDGRECMCGLEHLWEVRTRKQVHKYRQHGENKHFMVLTTQELIDGIERGKNFYLPIPKAQQFSEKEYVIPPYVLGVMIGDGCLTQKESDNKFTISNTEEDIIEKVAILTDTQRVYRNPSSYHKTFYTPNAKKYKDYLRNVGLCDYSYNRFIPREYLWGSIEQRRELLCGLMDTDGCVKIKNRYCYSTTSERLKDDFVYLCRSLGYIVTVGTDKRRAKYTTEVAYDINIQTDDIIFSSRKHLDKYEKNRKWIDENGFYSRTKDHVLIESITYKCNEDALCILVEDKDHLYIAGDFVTTHNTFGAAMYMAESILDPKFRGCFVRRTLGELKVAGGVVEKFQEVFGSENISVKMSDSPLIRFPSGATVECRQIQNEDRQKVIEQWKGSEYDTIAFEELTGFSWETFTYLMSRNRGKAKNSGHIIATTNPKKSHWVRKFIDGYIKDSHIDPDMDCVVRYFFINGEKVEDVVWGKTKEEVYLRCKNEIDELVKNSKVKVTYESFIKSFTFIHGKTSENVKMLENNPGYLGSVAATGAKQKKILLEGNWDIDEDEEDDKIPIKGDDARFCLVNEECRNGNKWITADLADVGSDNSVFLAWDGFHIYDIMVIPRCVPRDNAQWMTEFAVKNGIPDSHIIYDATRALYINDYIPDAIPYVSSRQACGILSRSMRYLKDECYMRLTYVITNRMLSIAENVSSKIYMHQKVGAGITVGTEFLDECAVVRFEKMANGKQCLMGKKEMNRKLGRGRSMDVLDPMAIRMYPILNLQVGEELEKTAVTEKENEAAGNAFAQFNIYDESNWC